MAHEKEEGREPSRMRTLARRMFWPENKKPYIFNGKPLKDLKDLKDYLVAFTGKEALWVAAWIEYLGDHELARNIRDRPKKFKELILKRYEELKLYSGS